MITEEVMETGENPVLAIDKWKTNGHLIADCARLGFLSAGYLTLDVTYGYGNFWTEWSPETLIGIDLNPSKSPSFPGGMDFRSLVFEDRSFTAVVYDPPYKLNGAPDDDIDERYGVNVPATWQKRMQLIADGAAECARVSDLMLLVKVQDQVVSSKIRWQTKTVERVVEPQGFGLRARFDFLSYRPQDETRTQRNPRSCSSQLLVFQRDWRWED